jgi:phosphatidylglycerol lysyltransferase
MRFRSVSFWGPVISIVLIAAALRFLSRELQQVSPEQIWSALTGMSGYALLAAVALTVLNYGVLAGYEHYACRYAGVPQPLSRIAVSSFIGNAFANTLGFSFLSGSSIKFRLYSAWGLTPADVGRIAIFTTVSLWLGLVGLGGLALVLSPEAGQLLFLGSDVAGVGLAVIPVAYVLVSLRWRKDLNIFGFHIPAPGPKTALVQVAFSVLDWGLSGFILFVLLPEPLPLGVFFSRFMLAQLAGVMSQAPGGVGVFETAFMLLTPDAGANGQLFAALLAFRVVYYILPLLLGAATLAVREVLETVPVLRLLIHAGARWSAGLVPQILAVVAFAAGAILLLSGATPALEWRLAWLADFLPDAVVGGSHMLGAVIGVSLLFLARGIQRRLDVAYHLTVLMLVLGMAASLLRGADFEAALVLGLMLVAFMPHRNRFTRHSSLFSDRFSPGWIVAMVLVLVTTTGLVVFSVSHGRLAEDFWLTFTLDASISNVLRAWVGAGVAGLCLAIMRLLAPAPYRPAPVTDTDMNFVRAIVGRCPHTRANLALLGDKTFEFSASRQSLLMFGVTGRTWVSMGPPVGRDEDASELIWQFREACDRHSGRPVFYGVPQDKLHLFWDTGLSLMKIGEEAIVDLPSFHLNGAGRQGLRYKKNNLEKNGCEFAMIPPSGFAAIETEVRTVSEAWLALKHAREKRFSLGCYDPAYLSHFHTAVVRKDGRILAFGNVWTGGHSELAIDLMRFVPGAPRGVMDYLIFMLMFWGQAQGYARFNLGVSPFSGLESHALAPVWNKVGNFLYSHAEDFYNFRGLRAYKEKFGPAWEPSYLLAPGGLALPGILTEVAALVAGGVRGMVGK